MHEQLLAALKNRCQSYSVIKFIKTYIAYIDKRNFADLHTPKSLSDLNSKDVQTEEDEKKWRNKKRRRKPKVSKIWDPSRFHSDYYFENGFRKVYPYMYKHAFNIKQHWIGRTLIDVYTLDFHIPQDTVELAIAKGRVRVNGDIVSADYVLKTLDLIQTESHRHEYPVIASPIQILVDNSDVLVVNKPSSIPCHPCGSYGYNSLKMILCKEMGYENLWLINRLDRPTSGVTIIAKNLQTSAKLSKQLSQRKVQKEYICRVEGEFPRDEIVCEERIGKFRRHTFIHRITPKGHSCKTVFQRLSYNGHSSVVKCIPYTGRTHQIRVHLQYLGHPITNDNLYNTYAFGPNKGKGGNLNISDDKIFEYLKSINQTGIEYHGENKLFFKRIEELKNIKQNGVFQDSLQPKYFDHATKTSSKRDLERSANSINSDTMDCWKNDNIDTICTPEKLSVSKSNIENMSTFDWNKWFPVEDCEKCRMKCRDPDPRELTLYLHALKYKGMDWEYETSLPEWATDNWQEPSLDFMSQENN